MTKSSPTALGLDIGGTNLKAAVLQLPNRIGLEFHIPSRANEGPDGVRAAIREAVAKAKSSGALFDSIGVGCAGSVSPQGTVRNSPNFSHWKDVPLKEWVETDHSVRAVVENDANCAAVTEWTMGSAQGARNVLAVTLGTGIGGGLIIENRLFRGATGTAGEIGHFSIQANGIPCNCGNTGCFERYCSASGLKRKLPGVSAEQIFLPENRDQYGPVVDEFLQYLGVGLTSLVNVFDPEVVVVAGGISAGMGPHWKTIREHVKEHAFPAVGAKVQILPAKYESNSGALGAALIALGVSG